MSNPYYDEDTNEYVFEPDADDAESQAFLDELLRRVREGGNNQSA